MTEGPTKPKKVHQTVGLDQLNALFKTSGLPTKAIAEALGITESGLSGWRSAGKMPKLASVACEGLIRRQQGSGSKRILLLVTCSREAVPDLKLILGRLAGCDDVTELKI